MKSATFTPTPFTRTRGTRIRDARLRRGLTQEALAKKLGVSRVMVSYWESGQADKIPLPQIYGLMTCLEIEPRELYDAPLPPLPDLEYLAKRLKTDMSDDTQPPQSPAAKLAQRRLSEAALTLAMLWDELPIDNELKKVAAQVIEQAHRAHDPKYWAWSDTQPRAANQRPAKPRTKK